MSVQSFLSEFNDVSIRFCSHENELYFFQLNEQVQLQFVDNNAERANSVILFHLDVAKDFYDSGFGTQALEVVKEFADKHGVTVTAAVISSRDKDRNEEALSGKYSDASLRQWYIDRGFEDDDLIQEGLEENDEYMIKYSPKRRAPQI